MPGTIPTLKLNNGQTIPVLGLGTWKSEPGEVGQAVKDAIDLGYRQFDCAHLYQNEDQIGTALREKIEQSGGKLKREELFITSKLWNTHHAPQLVLPALKETLRNLQVDYLDLYLMHFPTAYLEGDNIFPIDPASGKMLYSDVDFIDTWKAMEECVQAGLTKSIGLANFNSKQVERILEHCTIKPVMNQVECHPYLPQRKLVPFCMERGLLVTSYSPLGSGDRPWATPTDPILLEDPKLVQLAKPYGKTPAQVLLRWQVQRGLITIPKAVNKKELSENIAIFNFSLREEDMESLGSAFERVGDGRYLHGAWFADHKYFPFGIEF